MGGTADGGQTAGQDAPEDMVSVREAAQVVGLKAPALHYWIRQGRLTSQPGPGVRRVSLAAVRALCAPLDPQTPPEARLVYEVARVVGVPKGRIWIWAQRSLLPSWHGSHGLLVREVDVRALAQKRGLLPRSDEAGA